MHELYFPEFHAFVQLNISDVYHIFIVVFYLNKSTQRRRKRNRETVTNVSAVKNHKIFRFYLYLHWFSIMYSSVYIFECFSFIEYENKFRVAFIFTLFAANIGHSHWRRLHFLRNSCIKLSVRIEIGNLMIFSLHYILNRCTEKIYSIQIKSYLCRHKVYFKIYFGSLLWKSNKLSNLISRFWKL